MRQHSKWATFIAITACWAVIFAVCGMTRAAATTTAGGSVTGTVTKDGQPAAYVKIAIIRPLGHGARGARAGKHGPGRAGGVESPTTATTGGGKNRPEPIAQTTTDKDGKFSINGLAPGEYVVVAHERGEGRAHERITITDGGTATVSLTLRQRPVGSPKAGGHHNGNAKGNA